MSTKREDHPFYCYAKNCQKSAWATPEFLSEQDWSIVEAMIGALEAGDEPRLLAVVRPNAEAVFYRIMAWPEGRQYYAWGSEAARAFYFPGFVLRELPKLRTALASRHGDLFAATEPAEAVLCA